VDRNDDGAREESKPVEVRALRGRFGLDVAERLLRTANQADRRRAIDRAASLGTPEAVGFLVEQASRISSGDGDGRTAIACARALALFGDSERARNGLYELTVMPSRLAGRDPGTLEDPFDDASRERARSMAALGLARTRDPRALTLLADTIRGNGAGATAAKAALYAYPPERPTITTGNLAPQALDFVVASGDLRALPAVLALTDSADDRTRAAAIVAMADLRDTRVVAIATPLVLHEKSELRVASTYALARLHVPAAEKALLALFETDVMKAVEISEWVQSDAITKVLAATAIMGPSADLRAAATLALGRQSGELAGKSLLTLSLESTVTYEAVHALSRSPADIAMSAITTLLAEKPKDAAARATIRLAARAYLVRAKVRGERSLYAEEKLAELARSSDALDRAVAIQARIALGLDDAARYLQSQDKDVRRAALMGMVSRTDKASRALLADRLLRDDDAAMRELSGNALLIDGDDAPKVTSAWLSDRATSGGPDAPLAVQAYVRRADEKDLAKVDQFLVSSDPIVRIHAARGLGNARMPQSMGRLADLYAFDPDARVRRAALLSLLQRPERTAPLYTVTLREAAALDPDAETRFLAQATLQGRTVAPPPSDETAWIRTASSTGMGATTAAAPYTATYLSPDGTATPLVFDREGHAVVLGIPPGKGLLRMTPVLP
jgi:HEAT repeat protein